MFVGHFARKLPNHFQFYIVSFAYLFFRIACVLLICFQLPVLPYILIQNP